MRRQRVVSVIHTDTDAYCEFARWVNGRVLYSSHYLNEHRVRRLGRAVEDLRRYGRGTVQPFLAGRVGYVYYDTQGATP